MVWEAEKIICADLIEKEKKLSCLDVWESWYVDKVQVIDSNIPISFLPALHPTQPSFD